VRFGVPGVSRNFILSCFAGKPMGDRQDSGPLLCHLEHPVFSRVGEPLFRRAESDNAPVMVVQLGEREAVLPLRSLQREFGIPDDSADGRMLAQIAASLDFVAGLHLGDPLPAEVLSGEASWDPSPAHFQVANAKLRLQLVAWLRADRIGTESTLDPKALIAAADDPASRQQVQEAFRKAAGELGQPSPDAVVELVEDLGRELAYIEALRERLLGRVQGMAVKLERLTQAFRGDQAQLETLTQVRRLTGVAMKQIARRFAELDAQTGEVMQTLRNLDSQRTFIRSNRDWLYRTQRAWQPVLLDWDQAGFGFDEHTRALLVRTYQFLAPRFMSVTEWSSLNRLLRHRQDRKRRMIW
jgi:hypothetical protein